MESYLKCNIRSTIWINLARFGLSSHRFPVERGRWRDETKDIVTKQNSTLCNDKDIQDEIWC